MFGGKGIVPLGNFKRGSRLCVDFLDELLMKRKRNRSKGLRAQGTASAKDLK
jgi:hypothetical protein